MEKKYKEYDEGKVGMERRAKTAEVILALVIVFILTCSFLLYNRLYNKKKVDKEMENAVNEQVAQYF